MRGHGGWPGIVRAVPEMKQTVHGDGMEQGDPGEFPAPSHQRGHPLADLIARHFPGTCATDPLYGKGQGKKREEEERRKYPENEFAE